MSRIFKGSESTLRLLISKTDEYQSLTNLKIKLYTTDLDNAIEVIGGIEIEGNIAIINLAPRAFMEMADGIINYIVEGVVDGDVYHSERQSNYYLKTLSYISEDGVATTTLTISDNGEFKITPNDGLYVDVKVDIPIQEVKSYSISRNGAILIEKDPEYKALEKAYVNVDIPIQEAKTLEVKKNNTYTITSDEGFEGVKEVNLVVDVPIQYSKTLDVSRNKTYTINADDGFEGVKNVKVNVNIPVQETKDVTFTRNDTYSIVKDNEFEGVKQVNVTVAVPEPEIEPIRTVQLYSGDAGRITPTEPYVGLEGIDFTVADAKKVIPYGISFMNSTWTTFPIEEYDFSKLLDTSTMFANCKNFDYTPVLELFKSGELNPLFTYGMFANNDVVEEINGIDFSKFHNCSNMFANQTKLRTVRNCVMPYINDGTNTSVISTPSNKLLCKLIDCDWSNVKAFTYGCSTYHFANVNNLHKDFSGIFHNGGNYPTIAMDCPKPSGLKTTQAYFWYNPEKSEGWVDGDNVKPWGFWFNVMTNVDEIEEMKIMPQTPLIEDEIVLPYVGDRFYIDYPRFSNWDVYVNGNKVAPLSNTYNIDVYLPTTKLGVYEGEDMKKLIWYNLNDTMYTFDESGLKCKEKGNTSYKQNLATPGNTASLTCENAGTYMFVYINGTMRNTGSENPIVVDTSTFEYMDIAIYSNNTDSRITKIEIA